MKKISIGSWAYPIGSYENFAKRQGPLEEIACRLCCLIYGGNLT